MKFIKLTNYEDGTSILVNTERIDEVAEDPENGTTLVFIDEETYFEVCEDIDEVQELLNG